MDDREELSGPELAGRLRERLMAPGATWRDAAAIPFGLWWRMRSEWGGDVARRRDGLLAGTEGLRHAEGWYTPDEALRAAGRGGDAGRVKAIFGGRDDCREEFGGYGMYVESPLRFPNLERMSVDLFVLPGGVFDAMFLCGLQGDLVVEGGRVTAPFLEEVDGRLEVYSRGSVRAFSLERVGGGVGVGTGSYLEAPGLREVGGRLDVDPGAFLYAPSYVVREGMDHVCVPYRGEGNRERYRRYMEASGGRERGWAVWRRDK